MPTFEVERDEVTRLTYTVEAESHAAAVAVVEFFDDDEERGEPEEEILGHQNVSVQGDGTRRGLGAVLMLDAREHAHVLAALRLLRENPEETWRRSVVVAAYVESEGHEEMTTAEIDALVGRINT